jgi:hypothetical protein
LSSRVPGTASLKSKPKSWFLSDDGQSRSYSGTEVLKCHNFLWIAAGLFLHPERFDVTALPRQSPTSLFFRPKSPNLLLSAFLDVRPLSNDQINREVEI